MSNNQTADQESQLLNQVSQANALDNKAALGQQPNQQPPGMPQNPGMMAQPGMPQNYPGMMTQHQGMQPQPGMMTQPGMPPQNNGVMPNQDMAWQQNPQAMQNLNAVEQQVYYNQAMAAQQQTQQMPYGAQGFNNMAPGNIEVLQFGQKLTSIDPEKLTNDNLTMTQVIRYPVHCCQYFFLCCFLTCVFFFFFISQSFIPAQEFFARFIFCCGPALMTACIVSLTLNAPKSTTIVSDKISDSITVETVYNGRPSTKQTRKLSDLKDIRYSEKLSNNATGDYKQEGNTGNGYFIYLLFKKSTQVTIEMYDANVDPEHILDELDFFCLDNKAKRNTYFDNAEMKPSAGQFIGCALGCSCVCIVFGVISFALGLMQK